MCMFVQSVCIILCDASKGPSSKSRGHYYEHMFFFFCLFSLVHIYVGSCLMLKYASLIVYRDWGMTREREREKKGRFLYMSGTCLCRIHNFVLIVERVLNSVRM